MNILLTGATGTLGSYLAAGLVAAGHQVVAIKRKASSLDRIDRVRPSIVFYDIERLDLSSLFSEHGQVDAVIHAATCYGRKNERPSHLSDSNTLFPLRLLEMSMEFGVPAFINTGTTLDPRVNPYALSKFQFTEWARSLVDAKRIRFLDVQLDHIIARDDDQTKFTTWVVSSCLRNVDRIPLTKGEQQRDFVAVEDVVSAYVLLLKKADLISGGFNRIPIGSGRCVSIRHFVEKVHQLTNSTSRLDFGAVPYRDHELMVPNLDLSILRGLGWQPAFPLETSIQSLIDYQKHLRRAPV